jgi:HAD superfamily hydrolase (TIGR01509 family)
VGDHLEPREHTVALAIFDVDGTLVDSNHLHVLSWQRALRAHGAEIPAWVILAHMGVGGDRLVEAVAGAEVERRCGDAIRHAEGVLYQQLIHETRPLPGARKLLEAVRDRGWQIVLASSAKQEEVDHYLDLLDARGLVDGWTTSADVEQTKPAPDLVHTALEQAGDVDMALMIGDTAWDARAAAEAGIPCIGVTSGGIAAQELRDAGAVEVYQSAEAMLEDVDAMLSLAGAVKIA